MLTKMWRNVCFHLIGFDSIKYNVGKKFFLEHPFLSVPLLGVVGLKDVYAARVSIG